MPETWIASALSSEEMEDLSNTIDNIPLGDSLIKNELLSTISDWDTVAFSEASYNDVVSLANNISNETSKTDTLIQLDNIGGLLVANGGPRRPTSG